MKKFFVCLSLILAMPILAHAFDDANWASSLPQTGIFCDVQSDFAEFEGYDGWCRLGKVKLSKECEAMAKAFAESTDEDVAWEYVQIFNTHDPLAAFRSDRYGVNSVSGNTEEVLETHKTSFSHYSDLGDLSIDKRLSCDRAKDMARLDY